MTDNDRELLEKDGGPAFPVHPRVNIHEPHAGVSKREWFAGMALQGAIAHAGADGVDEGWCARWCYEMADAMLAQREKP